MNVNYIERIYIYIYKYYYIVENVLIDFKKEQIYLQIKQKATPEDCMKLHQFP